MQPRARFHLKHARWQMDDPVWDDHSGRCRLRRGGSVHGYGLVYQGSAFNHACIHYVHLVVYV
jgi:hypothetical protein